jgi:hypothetical protein
VGRDLLRLYISEMIGSTAGPSAGRRSRFPLPRLPVFRRNLDGAAIPPTNPIKWFSDWFQHDSVAVHRGASNLESVCITLSMSKIKVRGKRLIDAVAARHRSRGTQPQTLSQKV